LLVAGKYDGIEYSLASASDGPWTPALVAHAETEGPALKMEFHHLRFSTLTTAYAIFMRSQGSTVLLYTTIDPRTEGSRRTLAAFATGAAPWRELTASALPYKPYTY